MMSCGRFFYYRVLSEINYKSGEGGALPSLLSIIYYLLSIIYYLLSIICYLLSVIYYLFSVLCSPITVHPVNSRVFVP